MTTRLPTGKEALILELLARRGELYGLELVALSEGRLKRGTVYVSLGRLQAKGWVQVVADEAAGEHAGLPRPRYRLSAAGKKVSSLCRRAAQVLELATEVP